MIFIEKPGWKTDGICFYHVPGGNQTVGRYLPAEKNREGFLVKFVRAERFTSKITRNKVGRVSLFITEVGNVGENDIRRMRLDKPLNV